MKRVYLSFVFAILTILLSSTIYAGELNQERRNHIKEILEAIHWDGFHDAVIQYNLRIKIPEIDGHSAIDTWGTLIKHTGEEKRPTIVVSTPYRREVCLIAGLFLFPYGYNILAVDARGEWISFGAPEHTDLAYIIDHWIPKHEWSDGKVGLFRAFLHGHLSAARCRTGGV